MPLLLLVGLVEEWGTHPVGRAEEQGKAAEVDISTSLTQPYKVHHPPLPLHLLFHGYLCYQSLQSFDNILWLPNLNLSAVSRLPILMPCSSLGALPALVHLILIPCELHTKAQQN